MRVCVYSSVATHYIYHNMKNCYHYNWNENAGKNCKLLVVHFFTSMYVGCLVVKGICLEQHDNCMFELQLIFL